MDSLVATMLIFIYVQLYIIICLFNNGSRSAPCLLGYKLKCLNRQNCRHYLVMKINLYYKNIIKTEHYIKIVHLENNSWALYHADNNNLPLSCFPTNTL